MWLQTPRHAGVANAWYTHWMHVTVAGQIQFNMIYNTDTINWLHYWKNKVNVVLHTIPLTTLDPRGHPASAQTYSNHYFLIAKVSVDLIWPLLSNNCDKHGSYRAWLPQFYLNYTSDTRLTGGPQRHTSDPSGREVWRRNYHDLWPCSLLFTTCVKSSQIGGASWEHPSEDRRKSKIDKV